MYLKLSNSLITKLFFFDEHMHRLFSNHNFFNFSNISKNDIYKTAINILKKNNLKEGLLKIIILPIDDNFNDIEYYIFIRPLPIINQYIVNIKLSLMRLFYFIE